MKKQEETLLFDMLLKNMHNNEKEATKLLKKCIRDKELGEFYLKNLNPNFYRNQLLAHAIRTEETLLSISKNYATNLYACNRMYDNELANWALWFANITTDSNRRNFWRHFLDLCHELIKKNYPNVVGEIKARIKDWIGGWSKEAHFKNLDKLNDIYGARFILRANNHEDCEKLIETLHYITKDIIHLAIAQGLSLMPPRSKKDIKDFKPEEHPTVIIASRKTASILKEYTLYLKNYILTPKYDGYQSIHIIFVHPIFGKLEMQFRTIEMDRYAEEGPASHKKYKNLNPLYNFLMELAKSANPDTEHTDFIGLTKSESIHHRYLRYSMYERNALPKTVAELNIDESDLLVLDTPNTIY